ncbi:hypothetical protein ACHAPJ_013404 [Fusarium lateritium]
MAYLNNISMDHPDHIYAGALNRVAIGRAFKWLADKSRVSRTQEQASNTNPATLPPTRDERPAPGTAPPRGDNSTQECDEDDEVPSRSVLTRSQARRNTRKRIIDSSDEEADDEVQFVSSNPAPKKKSRIVTLKFTPLGGQKLSAAIGDCIMEPGQQNQSSVQEQSDDESSWEGFPDHPSAEGLFSPDMTHMSQEGAQDNYVAYLKERISKSNANIARTQSDIDTTTKRHAELLEKLRVNIDARDRVTTDVANARYALRRASVRCNAEAELQNELRRHVGEDLNEGMAEAVRLYLEAKVDLAAKADHLAKICNEVQMAEYQASYLPFKIDGLRETMRAEEKERRSCVTMCRLVDMGVDLVDALGDKTLNEWIDEQMREIGHGENDGAI